MSTAGANRAFLHNLDFEIRSARYVTAVVVGSGALLGIFWWELTDPQPIPIWIIEAKFGHAVKCDIQVRHGNPVRSNLPVILYDVFGIKVDNRLAGRVPMEINRLVHHQAAVVIPKHRPAPAVFPSLNAE